MRLGCVTVDCADPERVARFWAEALGWGGVTVADDGEGAICVPCDGGISLEFVRVPEPKAGTNRLHLGLNAGTLSDLDHDIERLLDLGASIAWEEDFPPEIASSYRNVVLRDPEGNEFCLAGGVFPRSQPAAR